MTLRRLSAVALAVLTVAAVATSRPARAAGPPSGRRPEPAVLTAGPLIWSDCGDGDQCATLEVPLDYRDPGDREVPVALRRRSAGDPARRIGSLVVNPGGPGESGTQLLHRDLAILGPEVRARFDVVEMDPRGTGGSIAIHCATTGSTAPDPVPSTPEAGAALLRADREYADACARAAGPLLPHLGTETVARDLEILRRALGDDRLTFLGISYGTLLGATYADLHPDRVRAMVLDGAIDPALDTATLSGDQAAAMDAQLAAFFVHCASGGCAWRTSGTPADGFHALADRLRVHPLVASDGTTVGVAELYGATLSRMYSPSRWASLAAALAAAERGDGNPLLALHRDYFGARPDATINADASNAVNCLDHPVDRDPDHQADLAARAAARAPVFGPYLSWGGAVCGVWRARPTRVPRPVTAPGAPPILVVGTTHDPATPFAWAQSLAGQLTSGVLVTREGTGHVGVLGSGCVRTIVGDYLVTGTPPAPGTACR